MNDGLENVFCICLSCILVYMFHLVYLLVQCKVEERLKIINWHGISDGVPFATFIVVAGSTVHGVCVCMWCVLFLEHELLFMVIFFALNSKIHRAHAHNQNHRQPNRNDVSILNQFIVNCTIIKFNKL
jgi:hypothetical protein